MPSHSLTLDTSFGVCLQKPAHVCIFYAMGPDRQHMHAPRSLIIFYHPFIHHPFILSSELTLFHRSELMLFSHSGDFFRRFSLPFFFLSFLLKSQVSAQGNK
jgi:hypothetical protein